MADATDFSRRTLLAAGAASLMPGTALAAREPAFVGPSGAIMVPVEGGRLYARVNGPLTGGKTPVLMIHGGPGSGHSNFMPALDLARDRAVILYDQLDCGRSSAPGDPKYWTIERFVGEIDAVRSAFELRRVHVLGSSWGGTLALEYAARAPAGLASLILQSPLVATATWLADAAALRDRLPEAARAALVEADLSGDYKSDAYTAAADVFYARHVRREPRPDWLTRYRDALPVPFADALYNFMWGPSEFTATGTLKDYDGTQLLPRIAAPTLLMCGEFDEARPETCRKFAARVPGGRFVEIAGAAHSIAIDRPHGFVEAVRAFIGAYD